MSESILFMIVLSLFFGFGGGVSVIRKFKGTDNANLKLVGMVVITAGFSVFQFYKYQVGMGEESESLDIMRPIFFGSIAFGALLSCAVYRLVRNA